MARVLLNRASMTRLSAAKSPNARAQRRLLAAGARIRGQWRYLVRTTRDPFASAAADGAPAPAIAKRPCERAGG
ncbi:MAG TPA: hypothetical protein VFD92_06470 [Candidatus Binatia bacterium]|nr:hypothetical protein [Candidatus Binatia bacterium]